MGPAGGAAMGLGGGGINTLASAPGLLSPLTPFIGAAPVPPVLASGSGVGSKTGAVSGNVGNEGIAQ